MVVLLLDSCSFSVVALMCTLLLPNKISLAQRITKHKPDICVPRLPSVRPDVVKQGSFLIMSLEISSPISGGEPDLLRWTRKGHMSNNLHFSICCFIFGSFSFCSISFYFLSLGNVVRLNFTFASPSYFAAVK